MIPAGKDPLTGFAHMLFSFSFFPFQDYRHYSPSFPSAQGEKAVFSYSPVPETTNRSARSPGGAPADQADASVLRTLTKTYPFILILFIFCLFFIDKVAIM